MATSTNTKIDIPLVLARLVPAAEYHWKGNGWGVYADVGEWRSPGIPKPTEAQVYAEWDVYLAETAQATSDETVLRNRIVTLAQTAVGVQVDQLTAAQVRALLVLLLRNAGALAPDGSIRALNLWVK